MAILIDAIKDFFPKKEKKDTAIDRLEQIEQEEVNLFFKKQEALHMEQNPIKTLKIPPPPTQAKPIQPQPQQQQQTQEPEPQEDDRQEVSIQDIIVATYEQTMELRKDVNAIIGLLMRSK